MKTALVFPGQGSQTVGMGKALADEFPVAREVFDRVDAALSQNLSHLMFEGPEAELTLTANAQPALMAASIAALKVLETETGLRRRPAGGLCRRPFARRVFGALRRRIAYPRGHGASLAAARRSDAEGGSRRRRRDGGHPRPRIRRGGEDRDAGGERALSRRRDLPGRQRQRRRLKSSFPARKRRSSAQWSSPSLPARSGRCFCPCRRRFIARSCSRPRRRWRRR